MWEHVPHLLNHLKEFLHKAYEWALFATLIAAGMAKSLGWIAQFINRWNQ